MLMHIEDQIVGWILECQQLNMRLESELRIGSDGGNFLGAQRRTLGVVEGLDTSPLDAHYVEREGLPAACVLGILS
jgi:hypothetical protein